VQLGTKGNTLAEDTPGCWDGSKAQNRLKKDVKKKKHLRFSPELLWISRLEYQEFEYNLFRKHVHQEARSLLETNYWIVKREKNEQMKTMIKSGKTVRDVDAIDNDE